MEHLVLFGFVLFLGFGMASCVVIGPLDWSRSELRRGQLDRIWANLMAVDVKLSERKFVCAPRWQDRCTTPRIFDVSTRWGRATLDPSHFTPWEGPLQPFYWRLRLRGLQSRCGLYGEEESLWNVPAIGPNYSAAPSRLPVSSACTTWFNVIELRTVPWYSFIHTATVSLHHINRLHFRRRCR